MKIRWLKWIGWPWMGRERRKRELVGCLERIASMIPPPMPGVKLPERFMTGHGLVKIKEIVESDWFRELAKDDPIVSNHLVNESVDDDPMEWVKELISRLCEYNKQLMAEIVKRHQDVDTIIAKNAKADGSGGSD